MGYRYLIRFVFLSLFLFSKSSFGQIIGVGYTNKLVTSYTDGNFNDTIYVWTSDELGKQNAKLKIKPKSGVGPFIFDWFYHDELTFSWKRFRTETGNFSMIENLPSDGYRVQVKDSSGQVLECHTAWTWNLNVESVANANIVNCNDVKLDGQINAESQFVYYNLPPPESIITANTKIKVEFKASHTYVSDLAFYLVGPASCGSPRILLSPNPGALNPNKHICNSGDNVNSLAFSNTSTNALDVCGTPAPLTGNYGSYSLDGKDYPIDWSPLIGCNAAQGGWSVQIYDCIYLDVGFLESASITFSDLESVCNSPTTISYSSGQIRSAIRDMSCSAETASIFQVLPHSNLRTPIVISANIETGWYQNNIKISNNLTHTVFDLPNGSYIFDIKNVISVKGVVFKTDTFQKELRISSTPLVLPKQTFCRSANPKVSDLNFLGNDLKWYLNETDTNHLPPNELLQSKIYYVVKSPGGCTNERFQVEIELIDNGPPVAKDQFFCENIEAKVSNLKAVGNNLKWYTSDTDTNVLNSDISLVSGYYYVSQTVNNCESVRIRVKVELIDTPEPIVTNQTFCSNTNPKVQNLVVTGTNVRWFLDETASNSLSLDTILREGFYYVTQELNGCESNRKKIEITLLKTDLPVAFDQLFCKQTSPKVSDLFATGNNLKWYLDESSLTVLNSNENLRTGSYYVTQQVDGCESNQKQIKIIVQETDAPVAYDQTFCANSVQIRDLVAQGENLKWYIFASGGEPLTLEANINDGIYYVSQTINGCESITRTPVKVVMYNTPKLVLDAVTFCMQEHAKILDLNIIGENIKFYKNEVGGTSLREETILSTGIYYVSQAKNGCESDRVPIQINIIPILSIDTLPNQTTCSGDIFNIKLPSSNEFVTYQWEAVSSMVLGASKGTGLEIKQILFTEFDQEGTVIYKITPIVNGCFGNTVELKVKVNPIPKVKIEIENNILCSGDVTQIKLLSNYVNTSYRWSAKSNGIIGATSGTGDIISQRLTTEKDAKVTYKIIPYIDHCEGEAIEVEVIVKALPALNLEDGFLCYEAISKSIVSPYIIDSELSSSNNKFEWFFEGDLIVGENGSSFAAFKKGFYTLKVTNNLGCSTTQTISVSENHSVQSAAYALTNYFRDSQTITVTVHGTGDYLYQINNEPPQKSNVFNHVLPGIHKVVITDRYNCTYIVFDEIVTVHYPNFFTPNGDGINDYWNIWSLKDKGQAVIFIFDRFGKLIKQISPQGDGWDGTIEGVDVPSTDYWFVVNYLENGIPRTFKSHFSLKR